MKKYIVLIFLLTTTSSSFGYLQSEVFDCRDELAAITNVNRLDGFTEIMCAKSFSRMELTKCKDRLIELNFSENYSNRFCRDVWIHFPMKQLKELSLSRKVTLLDFLQYQVKTRIDFEEALIRFKEKQ